MCRGIADRDLGSASEEQRQIGNVVIVRNTLFRIITLFFFIENIRDDALECCLFILFSLSQQLKLRRRRISILFYYHAQRTASDVRECIKFTVILNLVTSLPFPTLCQ